MLVLINTRWSPNEMVAHRRDCEPVLPLCDATHFSHRRGTPSRRCESFCVNSCLQMQLNGPDVADWESLIRDSEPVADARRGGADLACLFHTGGTTGRAKGVMLSHDNFMANSTMHIANLGLHEAAVHLHVSPMFHVAGGARPVQR